MSKLRDELGMPFQAGPSGGTALYSGGPAEMQVQGGGEKDASGDKLRHVACPLICLGGRDDAMPLDTRACKIRGWPLQNFFEAPLGIDHRESQSKWSWWLSTEIMTLYTKSRYYMG